MELARPGQSTTSQHADLEQGGSETCRFRELRLGIPQFGITAMANSNGPLLTRNDRWAVVMRPLPWELALNDGLEGWPLPRTAEAAARTRELTLIISQQYEGKRPAILNPIVDWKPIHPDRDRNSLNCESNSPGPGLNLSRTLSPIRRGVARVDVLCQTVQHWQSTGGAKRA